MTEQGKFVYLKSMFGLLNMSLRIIIYKMVNVYIYGGQNLSLHPVGREIERIGNKAIRRYNENFSIPYSYIRPKPEVVIMSSLGELKVCLIYAPTY